MKFQYALDESEHWQRLSFINTPVLDHSPLLSTETMLTVRAGLRKLSSEDRWQEGDRQSCRMVRQGEKITTHCMQKTRCKCSRRHCFTSQDTWWTERNSSGQTITGGSMSVVPMEQSHYLSHGKRDVMMHEHITFHCSWRLDIYEVGKKDQLSSKHIYTKKYHWYCPKNITKIPAIRMQDLFSVVVLHE